MIRLIQRRLIIPRGDTGTFSIPVLAGKDTGDASILTIFDPLTHRKLREKRMELSDGVLTVNFTHGDTVNLPVGQYVWDIKFYSNPVFADDQIIDGEEVDSYYAAFTLPVCEIRETGDNLLMDDDAPQAKLAPGQIDLITAAITEIQEAREAAANSAVVANTSATNAENSADAASISAQAAQNSEVAAAASQTGAAASAVHAASSAAAAEGAAVQAAEIAAQIHEEIPTHISQLIDDSGHYTKPVGGIPANDIADGVIPILTDLIDDTAGDGDTDKVWSADKITDAFDGLGQDFSHILTVLSSEIQAVNTVAQSKYTKPANGIPAADLEETYLTSFTETDPTVPSWAKAAQKPTYTAQEVGAPTVQQMNTALDEKAEKFTINLTLGEEQTITCDTLIEDIRTAYEEGKIIEGILTRELGPGMIMTLKTIGMVADMSPVIFMIEFIFDLAPSARIRITGGINPGSSVEWQMEQDYVLEASDNTDYNAQSKRITYLAAPTSNTDAVNKQYVDAAVSGKANSVDLAAVATSGSYTDLSNKPTIPSIEGLATEQYVDDSVEKFIVHFSSPVSIASVTCTETIAEIIEAYEAGKHIEGLLEIIQNDEPVSVLTLDFTLMKQQISTSLYFSCTLGVEGLMVFFIQGMDYNNEDHWYINEAIPLSAYVSQAAQSDPKFYAMGFQISQVGAPTANNDAATKQYVDNSTYAWAKAAQKPTYTAAEVGAPTTQEMNTAITAAIGNIHQFDIQVVQTLPSQDIQEHTVYFVPKTGETNDVYDEYIYINNAWEMIGNTQIDLSNYATKSEIPSVPVQDVQVNGISVMVNGIATISQVITQTNGKYGVMASSGTLYTSPATTNLLKQDYSTASSDDKTKMAYQPITTRRLPDAVFYGLAKAAGDSTQAVSSNAVGTYTDDAKTAIQQMLGVPSVSDMIQFATDTEIQNIVNKWEASV